MFLHVILRSDDVISNNQLKFEKLNTNTFFILLPKKYQLEQADDCIFLMQVNLFCYTPILLLNVWNCHASYDLK